MEIIFLGTSSGVPTKDRNVSAIALKEPSGKKWYLIDCGEGTQQQLLHCQLSMKNLNGIFITHVHGDHCYGLPGLLATIGMNGRTEPLKVFAPHGIKQWLEATRELTQWYLPYELEFISTETVSDYELSQFSISTTKLSHRVPSYAYSFTQRMLEVKLDTQKLLDNNIPSGPIWGQLRKEKQVTYEGRILEQKDFIKDEVQPQKIVIAGDNDDPSILNEQCLNAQVLIHESTYDKSLATKAKKVGHSYAELVAKFAQEANIKNLVLTHFSARFQSNEKSHDQSNSINILQDEARAVFFNQLYLAKDFQRYKLEKSGELILIETD